ncbi:MAG: hypothetical protein GXO29_02125 [Thermotogae bacterium]|nr:hypothetical protein [Thermotogota bacterium]
MMRYAYTLLFGALALVILGCRREDSISPEPDYSPPPPAPEVVKLEAINNGSDLLIVWTPVEEADGYSVQCDNLYIGSTTDTFFVISASENTDICGSVTIRSFRESDTVYASGPYIYRDSTLIDLHTKNFYIWVLESWDISDRAWIAFYLNGEEANLSITSTWEVDTDMPNAAYFVFDNDGGPQFKDVGATYLGMAAYEIAFSNDVPFAGVYLAPTAPYYTAKFIRSYGDYAFWIDDTRSGYNVIDGNDYFGLIEVGAIEREGSGYFTSLVIYLQNKVRGLRWIKSSY